MSNNILKTQYQLFDLGSDLQKVRDTLKYLNFNADINVLALQPGIGKTHTITKFLRANDNWLMTVPNHPLIDSEYADFKEINGINYWKGFKKGCYKYKKGDKKVLDLKKKHKLMPSIICQNCCTKSERKECPYKKQFNKSKNVLTVSSYYNTHYFYHKDGKFKFEIAIIDEEIKDHEKLELNEEEINLALNKIYEYVEYPQEFDLRDYFLERIEKKDLFLDEDSFETHIMAIKGIEKDQEYALKLVIDMKLWNDVMIINKLNISKLIKWLYYYTIYGENRIYSEPNIYKLFDLARQDVKVILSDASFDEKIFDELLKRYKFEDSKIPRKELLKKYNLKKFEFKDIDLSNSFNINVYTSHVQNKDLLIYRMWDGNHFNRRYIPLEIPLFIKKALNNDLDVGTISYMKKKDRIFCFDESCDFLYFGNLRGTNTFKDKEVIFIVGTPVPDAEEVLKDYNALFMKSETKAIKFDPKCEESDILDLHEYMRYLVDSELYQAIHRVRPFDNSDVLIFVFGRLKNKCKNEFNVKNLSKGETLKFFEDKYRGVYPLPLVSAISTYCWKNGNKEPEDIAKEFKLYRSVSKNGFNDTFIRAIRNGELNLNNTKIINELIKEGLNTVKDIKRKRTSLDNSLKVRDKIIEYCIYYAKNGDFIEMI